MKRVQTLNYCVSATAKNMKKSVKKKKEMNNNVPEMIINLIDALDGGLQGSNNTILETTC